MEGVSLVTDCDLPPPPQRCLLCASLHASPVKDSGNATATARRGEKERGEVEGERQEVENRRGFYSSLF